MLTFTGQRNLYGELTTGTANIDNLNFGDRIINAETRRLVSKMSDNLLHRTYTGSAVINQQFYEIPNRLKKVRGVTFTIGSNVQYVRKVPNRRFWDQLNTSTATAYTSDFPEWFYPIRRTAGFWPTPSSGSAVITWDGDARHIDLTIADYTTGTITTATSGTTRIVGSSTSWTDPMKGRYLSINKSNTNNSDGDGDYYEIASIVDASNLDLSKPYQGESITGGAATYLIGEVSELPDGFHELPVYKGAEFYYSKSDQVRKEYFKGLADNLEDELFNANDPTDDVVVEETDEYDTPNNPNNFPRSIG